LNKVEVISATIGITSAILVSFFIPYSPHGYLVFGDPNLCDDYPKYMASKPNYCYLQSYQDSDDLGIYDKENDRCADGYYASWTSVWQFECATLEKATDRCMRSYPNEFKIKSDGDIYKRTIEPNPEHFICASYVGNISDPEYSDLFYNQTELVERLKQQNKP
jgi:hypothetical protein